MLAAEPERQGGHLVTTQPIEEPPSMLGQSISQVGGAMELAGQTDVMHHLLVMVHACHCRKKFSSSMCLGQNNK